jgi:hypothetical protein
MLHPPSKSNTNPSKFSSKEQNFKVKTKMGCGQNYTPSKSFIKTTKNHNEKTK